MKRGTSYHDSGRSTVRLGKSLAKSRRGRGITAKWVADQLGITAGYMCDLEHGRRHLNGKILERYLKLLKIKP